MQKIYYILFVLVALVQNSKGQVFDPVLANKLQIKLDSMRLAHNIKGVSVTVIQPGQGMWQGVTGVSHAGVPITKHMEFGIASNSKLFTAATLMKLVEHKRLNLNDPLHFWLPTYPNIDSNITIRQLLNHISGIEDVNKIVGYQDSILSNPNRIFQPEEVMAWVGPPLFAPGAGWSYSNTNYILAGMIIERVTGQNFGKVLRDSILFPLKLDSTFLDVEEKIIGDIAHPWQNGNDINNRPRISLNSAAWAAGAMYSTSGEMAQWYHALMNEQILSKTSLKEMTTFVGSGNYGFGISRINLGGKVVWGHGGSIPGYQSFCAFYPLTGAVVCVLINANPSVPNMVANELLSTLTNFVLPVTENPLNENNLVVFPNPATDFIFLKLPDQKIDHIKIYSSAGHFIKALSADAFSIAELPNGTYLVVVQTDKGVLKQRVVKY
jgi:D-alanyl-D-alanine carboxypeptidase